MWTFCRVRLSDTVPLLQYVYKEVIGTVRIVIAVVLTVYFSLCIGCMSDEILSNESGSWSSGSASQRPIRSTQDGSSAISNGHYRLSPGYANEVRVCFGGNTPIRPGVDVVDGRVFVEAWRSLARYLNADTVSLSDLSPTVDRLNRLKRVLGERSWNNTDVSADLTWHVKWEQGHEEHITVPLHSRPFEGLGHHVVRTPSNVSLETKTVVRHALTGAFKVLPYESDIQCRRRHETIGDCENNSSSDGWSLVGWYPVALEQIRQREVHVLWHRKHLRKNGEHEMPMVSDEFILEVNTLPRGQRLLFAKVNPERTFASTRDKVLTKLLEDANTNTTMELLARWRDENERLARGEGVTDPLHFYDDVASLSRELFFNDKLAIPEITWQRSVDVPQLSQNRISAANHDLNNVRLRNASVGIDVRIEAIKAHATASREKFEPGFGHPVRRLVLERPFMLLVVDEDREEPEVAIWFSEAGKGE